MTTASRRKIDTTAVLVLLACCGFWGFQQNLIKATIAEVPAVWQASIRFAGAFAILWLWSRWRGISLWSRADLRSGVMPAGLLAGCLFAAEFACIYLGLRDTTASRLTVFLYTSPFVVALLLPRFVKTEALRWTQWLGLAMAFLAVTLTFAEGFSAQAALRLGIDHLRGDALALAAGLFWGLTTVVIRSTVLASQSPEKLLAYQLAPTAVAMPALSWGLGEAWSLTYSANAWLSLLLQTAAGAFASYLAWMWLLSRYPANAISSFVFLAPMFAVVFGGLWLNEALTLPLWIGLFGVALGIGLVNWPPSRRR